MPEISRNMSLTLPEGIDEVRRELFYDNFSAIDAKAFLKAGDVVSGAIGFNDGNSTKSFIQEVSGDLWITANAYWDGTYWQRVDIVKTAFAIQIQGTNTIPGELLQGINIWKAVPGSNPIKAIGVTGGWENVVILNSNGGIVIGGQNLEIKGNGALQGSGRLILVDGVGLYFVYNASWDGTNWVRDNNGYPATGIKIANNGKFYKVNAASGTGTITWTETSILDTPTNMQTGVKTVTSNMTLDGTVSVLLANSANQSLVITIPDAVAYKGFIYTIKRIGSNSVSIAPGVTGQQIAGFNGYTLTSDGACITVVSDGSNWVLINMI